MENNQKTVSSQGGAKQASPSTPPPGMKVDNPASGASMPGGGKSSPAPAGVGMSATTSANVSATNKASQPAGDASGGDSGKKDSSTTLGSQKINNLPGAVFGSGPGLDQASKTNPPSVAARPVEEKKPFEPKKDLKASLPDFGGSSLKGGVPVSNPFNKVESDKKDITEKGGLPAQPKPLSNVKMPAINSMPPMGTPANNPLRATSPMSTPGTQKPLANLSTANDPGKKTAQTAQNIGGAGLSTPTESKGGGGKMFMVATVILILLIIGGGGLAAYLYLSSTNSPDDVSMIEDDQIKPADESGADDEMMIDEQESPDELTDDQMASDGEGEDFVVLKEGDGDEEIEGSDGVDSMEDIDVFPAGVEGGIVTGIIDLPPDYSGVGKLYVVLLSEDRTNLVYAIADLDMMIPGKTFYTYRLVGVPAGAYMARVTWDVAEPHCGGVSEINAYCSGFKGDYIGQHEGLVNVEDGVIIKNVDVSVMEQVN